MIIESWFIVAIIMSLFVCLFAALLFAISLEDKVEKREERIRKLIIKNYSLETENAKMHFQLNRIREKLEKEDYRK
jgi:hypothetical protein